MIGDGQILLYLYYLYKTCDFTRYGFSKVCGKILTLSAFFSLEGCGLGQKMDYDFCLISIDFGNAIFSDFGVFRENSALCALFV